MIAIESISIFQDNYIWLILDSTRTHAIAVDPGEPCALLHYLQTHQIRLEAILITHHHFDHTGGIESLKSIYPVEVYGPKKELISGVTKPVEEPDVLRFSFLKEPIYVLDIPGHTLGHIAYYCDGKLLCGDTLFSAGCGRVFEGTMEQMYASIQKLAALPNETEIFCTHEYTLNNLQFAMQVEPTNPNISIQMQLAKNRRAENQPTLPSTIGNEKQINPFLRTHIPLVIQSAEHYAQQTLSTPLSVFTQLREWKNHFYTRNL